VESQSSEAPAAIPAPDTEQEYRRTRYARQHAQTKQLFAKIRPVRAGFLRFAA